MKRMEMASNGVEGSMQELNLNDDAQNVALSGNLVDGTNGYGQAQPSPLPNTPSKIANPSYSQPLLHQPQQIQQAGLGGASYYYSTSGNGEQQIYPVGRFQPPPQHNVNTSVTSNFSNVNPTSSIITPPVVLNNSSKTSRSGIVTGGVIILEVGLTLEKLLVTEVFTLCCGGG
jgi:hypothetical protein